MDKSYPISKIFDIDGLIRSFDIEVIGPATYVTVCGEVAASTVGITIGHLFSKIGADAFQDF
jgi:hypothetical protein